MRILIIGLNYAPEPIGIGPYTAGAAEALASAGHDVRVIAGQPYYPDWRVTQLYRCKRPVHSMEAGVRVTRVPLYVPRQPSAARRILHHASFAVMAGLSSLRAAWTWRPDLVMTVAPSIMSAPVARLTAWITGARSWLHVQDFEVGAALATGLLKPGSLSARLGHMFEKMAYGGFDRLSTISPQMCKRLIDSGFEPARIIEFRNYADLSLVFPQSEPSPYRQAWSIYRPQVALYSGNIANKQGLSLVVDAARLLSKQQNLQFVICGNGPQREALEESAKGLDNICFHDLQPSAQLSNLLSLATIHLLPQLSEAADLVSPSKLTNMLASGRPIIATAMPGTGLAAEVEGCGIVTPPGDTRAFAAAIAELSDSDDMRLGYGEAARKRAQSRWSKVAILSHFVTQVESMT